MDETKMNGQQRNKNKLEGAQSHTYTPIQNTLLNYALFCANRFGFHFQHAQSTTLHYTHYTTLHTRAGCKQYLFNSVYCTFDCGGEARLHVVGFPRMKMYR